MPSIKPTTFVKEYAPWSVSKAGAALNCPHQFYLRYVKKVKVDVPRGIESLVGSAVHSVVEWALQGELPVEMYFKMSADEHNLTTEEFDLALDFAPAVKAFLQKYRGYSQRHRLSAPQLEKKLAIDFDGNPTKFFDNGGFLRGVVDMYALKQGEPTAVVLDHKTGKEKALSYFKAQFDAYTVLLKLAGEPHLEKLQLGINFLKTGKVEMEPKVRDLRDIQPWLDDVTLYLNEATTDTHNFDTCKRGPLCNWCDYKKAGICPAFSGGINGKKEK